jgi:hypothetical protein
MPTCCRCCPWPSKVWQSGKARLPVRWWKVSSSFFSATLVFSYFLSRCRRLRSSRSLSSSCSVGFSFPSASEFQCCRRSAPFGYLPGDLLLRWSVGDGLDHRTPCANAVGVWSLCFIIVPPTLEARSSRGDMQGSSSSGQASTYSPPHRSALPNAQSPASGKLAGDASPSAECHLIVASGEPGPASGGRVRRRAERRPSSGRARCPSSQGSLLRRRPSPPA